MATPPVPLEERTRRWEMVEQLLRDGFAPPGMSSPKGSAFEEAGRRLGLGSGTLHRALSAEHRFQAQGKPYRMPDLTLYAPPSSIELPPEPARPSAPSTTIGQVLASLRKTPRSLEEIAAAAGITRGQALDALEAAQAAGRNLHELGGRWSIERDQAPSPPITDTDHYVSRPDNRFVFGLISDNHYCSKYERDDVAQNLYDRFAAAGVDRVFNAGNWIDGEAPFNKWDLKVHGLEPQLRYFAEHYPRRPGIVTYAIAGEDHEGWLARREAIDIGRFTERLMRESGRDDWRHIGFMEAYVPLVNANTGARQQLLVMHPGGGSAYATSYRPQKIVESLEGGEKPAILAIGHYHKLSVNLVRNVWALQVGCTQDQTVFMRKKNIDAHIGGMICEAEQDPATGAIISCKVEIVRYFNQSYYNDRWSNSGSVVLPERHPNREPRRSVAP